MDRARKFSRSNVSVTFRATEEARDYALAFLDDWLTLYCREALYEDESFPERSLAALVASKIYYHLQEYDESMVFALGAGKLFDIEREGEFEDTIIGTHKGQKRQREC